MSERFVYWAFLTVVFAGLLAMTVSLAAIGYFLLQQNRRMRAETLNPPPPDAP